MSLQFFQGLQLAGLGDLHAAKARPPLVGGLTADAVLAAQILADISAACFLQDRDDVLFRKPVFAHRLSHQWRTENRGVSGKRASVLQLHGPGATAQSDHQSIDALLSDLQNPNQAAATEVYFRRGYGLLAVTSYHPTAPSQPKQSRKSTVFSRDLIR